MEGTVTECACVFFLQFISTMENIILYFMWDFSSSDTFYVFSVMYRAMDERQRHRKRMEDNVQRSQMKMGWKTQAKIMISRYLTLTIKVKIKKNTHFTMNVLKRNIRTNFLFVILYIFVVKKRHISMLKVIFFIFFGRNGAFLCNLWSC